MKTLLVIFCCMLFCTHSLIGASDGALALRKNVQSFFATFDEAYTKGDTNTLSKMLSESQQEWCFKEILDRGDRTNLTFSVDIDEGSLVTNGVQCVVHAEVSRQFGNERSPKKQHVQFVLKDIKGTLLLVDTKNPEVQTKNALLKQANSLGREFQDAVNIKRLDAVRRLLGMDKNAVLSRDLSWISSSNKNDGVRITYAGVDQVAGQCRLKFSTTGEDGKASEYALYLVVKKEADGTKYTLTNKMETSAKRSE